MDTDLKNYLDALETRLSERTQAMETRIANVIAGEVAAIHADMGNRFDAVEARFDSIDARLKLQAGLIQSGARALARFSDFAENSEARWVSVVERVAAIEKRLGMGGAE